MRNARKHHVISLPPVLIKPSCLSSSKKFQMLIVGLPDVEHYIVVVDGPVRSPRRFFKTVLSQACFGKIGMISVSSNYLSERIEGKSSYRVHVDEMYGVPAQ